MENVLKLERDMQVELQGWLVKRGAGYSEEDDEEETSAKRAFLPFKGLKGKGDKSRYFILVKNDTKIGKLVRPSSTIYYYNKPPKIVKDKAHGEVEEVGKGGQRATRATRVTRATHAKGGYGILKRGLIELSAECQIELKEGEIKLVTPGRTYFLRSPAKKVNNAEKVYGVGQWFEGIRKMITWLQNFKMQQTSKLSVNYGHLNRLSVAYQRQSMLANPTNFQRKESVGFNNIEEGNVPQKLSDMLAEPFYRKEFQDFLEYRQATENLLFYDKIEEYKVKVDRLLKVKQGKAAHKDILAFAQSICREYIEVDSKYEINISSDLRNQILEVVRQGGAGINAATFDEPQKVIYSLMETNFRERFYRDLLQRTGCFASLFHQCGLAGYEAIVQRHFGSVMAESQRMLDMYRGKMEAVDKQIQVIEATLGQSYEVVSTTLRSFQYALLSSYGTSMKRLEALSVFKTELQENCINRLVRLIGTLKTQLSIILEADGKRIEAWQDTSELSTWCANLEQSLIFHQRMVQQNAETLERANEDLGAKFKVKVTAENFTEMVEKATADKVRLRQKERSEYKDLSEELSDSLNNLEKLDLHRLGEQQAVMSSIVVAEGDLYTALTINAAGNRTRVERINVKKDVESLARGLNNSLTDRLFSV